MRQAPLLTAEYVRSLLDYDPATGILRWRVRKAYQIPAGSIIDSLNQDGYIRFAIDGKKYYAHRVIFLYVTGRWPEQEIDHIDSNRSNNSWDNLREASRLQNTKNKKISEKRKNEYKCVYPAGKGKFYSTITANRKVYKLGIYNTAEEAYQAYCKAAVLLHGEFARQ